MTQSIIETYLRLNSSMYRMDPDADSDVCDDLHLLLDQLYVPAANADPGGADDKRTAGEYHSWDVCI